jgi:hypothetical protein
MIDEIRQWKPDDMDDTATHFNSLADKREDTMAAIKAADTAVWTGQGGEGKDITIAQHAATTSEDAAMFRATAQVATEGGQALYGLQQQLVNTVDTAKNSAWQVDDSGQVTDTIQDPWERAVRQPFGVTLQSTVLTQAAAFQNQQAVTAAGLTPEAHTPRTIHATPYPGDLMDRDRENPLPTPPGKGGAWRDMWSPYGDNMSPHDRLEHCGPDREGEDLTRATLGIAGISSGNAVLGIVGSTMGVEGGLKDLFRCEPPGGVH